MVKEVVPNHTVADDRVNLAFHKYISLVAILLFLFRSVEVEFALLACLSVLL
jgi:hypothetical protein